LSVGLLITFGAFRYWIGGDIETATEAKLAARDLVQNVDVYQAHHHGADNGSTDEFLRDLLPTAIIISNGSHAKYRHPQLTTLTRMRGLTPAPVIYQTNKFLGGGSVGANVADSISFRSLNEITKIDSRTGAVLWRLGGSRKQFTFSDSGPPVLRQHGVRVVQGGFVLLDNFGEAAGSRAERYKVDEAHRSAQLTGIYLPPDATRASLGGSTQDLPGQNTLVAFGDGGMVQEYDSDGAVAWQIEGNVGYPFRAQRIRSLYHPEIGLAR
jgi:hypothetical protein